MSKAKKVASIAFTGAAAAVATTVNAAPALAAGNWTVAPGGPYTATNVTPAILNANGISLTCSVGAASASGSLPPSATGTPTQLGTIAKADFGKNGGVCSLVGFGLTVSANLTSTAQLWGNAYDSGTGVTQGSIRNISASINGTNGFACHMKVTGQLPGSYRNESNRLVVNPGQSLGLTVQSVTGCIGVQAGDPAWFSANYSVTPAQTITES
jgi:hypothetical protein